MIVLNILCGDVDEKCKFRDRLCEALVGSPAFINSEIAVTDFEGLDRALEVFIGKPNGADIEFDLMSGNFGIRYDEKEDKNE